LNVYTVISQSKESGLKCVSINF